MKKSLVQLAQNLKPWFSGTCNPSLVVAALRREVTDGSHGFTRPRGGGAPIQRCRGLSHRCLTLCSTGGWLLPGVIASVRAYGRSRHQEQRRVPDVLRPNVSIFTLKIPSSLVAQRFYR